MKKINKCRGVLLAVLILLTLLPVSELAADIEMGVDTPAFTVNTSTIGFAGQEWWVIGYNGTGAYTTPGDTEHATLLLKSSGNPYGNVKYNSTGNSIYPGGELHTVMTGIYTAIGAKEQALITARTIDNIWDGSGPYNNTGTLANQYVWPLSLAEWSTLDLTVRSYGSWWWLRSPSAPTRVSVSNVTGVGTGYSNVEARLDNDAARPALNLDLTSVLFTSAATGGKSDAVAGSATLVATTVLSSAIKLTVLDSALTLNVADTTPRAAVSGATVGIAYTNAQTGSNRSVSVLVCDALGNPVYYGRPVDCTATNANGTARFTVPVGLAEGSYTIKIFNEEVNADNYTDYASTPISIPLTIDNTAPVLSAGTVARTSDAYAVVKFTSNEAGQYFFQIVGDDVGDPIIATTTPGTVCSTTEVTLNLTGLVAGGQDIWIYVKDAAGNVGKLKIDIPVLTPAGDTTPKSNIPKTGDNSKMYVWPALALIAVLGMCVTVRKRRLSVK